MGDRILCQHSKSIRCNEFWNSVVNLFINMVGTSGKNDSFFVVLTQVSKSLLALFLHIFMSIIKFLPGLGNSSPDFAWINTELLADFFRKTFLQMLLALKCHEWIHEEDGSFNFEDQPPRRNCVYDVVNLKLPQGAAILDFGGAPDILKRIRLENNEYTHLETRDSEPVLVAEAVKNGIGIPTTRYTKLEYIPLQEDIRCDFEELCKKNAPDNIYHVTYSEGRYRLTDMYGSKIITKQEAMRYQAEWT